MKGINKLYCCNQMGDKDALIKHIQALEDLVEEAFIEGFGEAFHAAQVVDKVAWQESETLKQLRKLKKEVI